MPRCEQRWSRVAPTSARCTRSRTSRSRTRTSPRADYGRIPPTVLVLIGIGSVQIGSALAKTLFDDVGPGGTVLVRIGFAALLLALLWRPSLRDHSSRDRWLVGAFGLTLAAMNLTFYLALDHIPLGAA